LNDVITAGRRTSEVIGDIRTLFGRVDHRERGPVDVNALILGILRKLGVEFEHHGVETSTELTPELPFVDGNGGQLQEVIYNLVRNAVEAMGATTNRARLLRVRTELRGRDAIAIAVEDTGPGIEPTKLSTIFDAFTTTKSDGMGLGLTICRMISEHHGGQLTKCSQHVILPCDWHHPSDGRKMDSRPYATIPNRSAMETTAAKDRTLSFIMIA
jgi:signal transduction histidine kinase